VGWVLIEREGVGWSKVSRSALGGIPNGRGAHPRGALFLGLGDHSGSGQASAGRFEVLLERVPLVKTIYGGIKIFLAAFQTKPPGVERVVLIDFPSPEMKTIGLVTRTMIDEASGEELAVVYVPTSPNPTGGYIQFVPLAKVISTDWTLDEAMQFLMTAGTAARNTISFARNVDARDEPAPAAE
jgi:uncharacterized membrane protein